MLDPFVILTPFFFLPLAGLLRFIGCADFSSTDVSAPIVKIDPATTSLKPGDSQQFTALVDGSPSTTSTWSGNAPNGKLTAPVPFVPGSAPVTVTATYASVSASATVTLVPIVVTVTPTAVSLKPGESQQFTALVDGVIHTDVTWPANAPNGKYSAPTPYVIDSPPVNVTVTYRGATATASVRLIGNAAQLVTVDMVNKGTWRDRYGSTGYALAHTPANLVKLPTYLPALNIAGLGAPFTFVALPPGTGDARGVEEPPPAAPPKRFAEVWHDANLISLEIVFGDFDSHVVGIYMVDWLMQGRAQDVTILDNSVVPAITLFHRSFAAFDGGQTLILRLSGKVLLQIARTGTPDAVLSAIYFD